MHEFGIGKWVRRFGSRCATGDDGLLEQVLRCGRRDDHRFLPLYLSVPFSHCASSARNCLAPKGLFLWSTPWTSVGNASLSLSLPKGRTIQDAPPDSPNSPNSINSITAKSSNKPHPPKPHQLNNSQIIKQASPAPQSRMYSTTPYEANQPQKQTNHPILKKQPPKTNPHNFKDENGDWIQSIFSE